jgi:site-specific recombinase XerD
MKTPVSFTFVFRKPKDCVLILVPPSKKPVIPPDTVGTLVLRLTVRGKRTTLSTYIRLPYAEWSAEAQRVQGSSERVKRYNRALVKMLDDLHDLHADLERQGRPVSAQALARLYKSAGSLLSLPELYTAYLAERQALVGIEISAATLKSGQARLSKLMAFLEAHGLPDLRPEEFGHSMGDKYLHWLLIAEQSERNTALKHLKYVSQVLKWAVRREHLSSNPMALYEYRMNAPKEIIYLTSEEIARLAATEFRIKALERARDNFLFQCWTGLAYADLRALDVAACVELDAETGRRVLRVVRQKSTLRKGYECVIPLLPEAERILAKYGDRLRVPVNQLYNYRLKEVGLLCDISSEKMTSHVGRKTAAVQLLNQGIRMEVVSKFLGHSSVKMTETTYAFILNKTVVSEFDRVFGGKPTPPPAAPGFTPEPEAGRVIQFHFGT